MVALQSVIHFAPPTHQLERFLFASVFSGWIAHLLFHLL